jgi:DNA-binding MarR family transcriptional regulator
MRYSKMPGVGPLGDLLGYALRRAQLRMLVDLKRSLEPLRLRPVTFGVLAVVEANPDLSQVGVGTALDIQRANLVGIIAELESRGWIVRGDSPVDRRQYSLRLTSEGSRVLKRAWSVVRAHEERLLIRLSARGRRRLMSMLVDLMPAEVAASKSSVRRSRPLPHRRARRAGHRIRPTS